MNKKGFTIIELLVTIAIIISLTAIVVVAVLNVSNKNKEQAYERVKQEVINAGESFFETNEYLFDTLADGTSGKITVGKLVKDDYLNKVTDPRDGNKVNYCDYVEVTKTGNTFTTKYVESDETECDDTNDIILLSEPGAPLVELTVSGDKGNNNWYVSDVSLTAHVETNGNGEIASVSTCSQEGNVNCANFTNLSDIKSSYENTYSDTNQITVGYKVTNISGKSSFAWQTFKIDTVNPECGLTLNGTEGNTSDNVKWYLSDVKLDTSCKDDMSGCLSKPSSKTYSTEGVNNAKTTVKDEAGNENTCNVSFGIEKNPTMTISSDTEKSVGTNGSKVFASGTTYFTSNLPNLKNFGGYSCSSDVDYCYYANICKNVVSFDILFQINSASSGNLKLNDDQITGKTRLYRAKENANYDQYRYYVYDYYYDTKAGHRLTVRTFEEYGVDCGY